MILHPGMSSFGMPSLTGNTLPTRLLKKAPLLIRDLQRKNLRSPTFLRMIRDVLRFGKEAPKVPYFAALLATAA